jgi:prolipoprotein diacylglyceryltransferase
MPSLLRPSISIGGRAISTFQLWGVSGFVAAAGIALALGGRLGLSPALLAALAAAAAVTFFVVVLATRAIARAERLVYYHHELAVLAVAAALLAALGRPVLAYLDVALVALGVFLAFGRLGCAMVGCCHGRPHRFGLRYGAEHADAGFADWLVGVPLFPVQLIESFAVAALTAVGAARLWAGAAPPGAVLAAQLVGYALLRFVLELGRGDRERPTFAGLSEAQWISVALASAVVAAELGGWLPRSAADLSIAAGLAIALAAVVIARARRGSPHRLLAPDHVAEVARALSRAEAAPPGSAPAGVPVFTTSLGVCLSCTRVDAGTRLYSFSGVEAPAARALSSLVLLLRPDGAPIELLHRRPGLFQLLVTSEGAQSARPAPVEPR